MTLSTDTTTIYSERRLTGASVVRGAMEGVYGIHTGRHWWRRVMVSNVKTLRARVIEGLVPVLRIDTLPEQLIYYDPDTEFFWFIEWRKDGKMKTRANIADMGGEWINQILKQIWHFLVYDRALAFDLGERFCATIIVEEL